MARRQRLRALPGRLVSPKFILAAGIGIAFALLAMGQLNELHRGMHVSGDPAYVTADLDHVVNWGPDADQAEDVLTVWRKYRAATAEYGGGHTTATPFEVTTWFVLIDTFVLVPLYCGGLIVLLIFARRKIKRWKTPEAPRPEALDRHATAAGLKANDLLDLHRWAASLAIAYIAIAAAADVLENVGYWTLARFGSANAPPYGGSDAFRWRVDFLWWSAVVKWLFAVLAVVLAAGVLWQFLVEWMSARRRSEEEGASRSRLRARIELTIVQVVLVTLFGVALLGHEQLADVIRRWTLRQFLVTAAMVTAFAILTWLVTRRLLVRGQWEPGWIHTPAGRRRARLVLFWAVIGGAGLQLALNWATSGESTRPGWGLVVPAVALLVIALLGLLVRSQPEPNLAPPLEPATSEDPPVPRLLAAATLVFFGFGIFHALFGFAVFERAWTWWALLPIVAALGGAAISRVVARRRSPLWGATVGVFGATILLAIPEERETDASIILAVALMLPFFAWRLYSDLSVVRAPDEKVSRRVVISVAVAIAVAAIGIVVWPIDVGQAVGVVAILAAFMLAIGGLAGALVWAARAVPVPRALVALHFSRFPLVALIVFWFVAAALADDGRYHDVRIEPVAAAAGAPTLTQAFDCWLAKNSLVSTPCPGTSAATGEAAVGRDGAVPLFLVASTGGGIRAAFWTALVLDCAFEVDAATVTPDTPCLGDRPATFDRSNSLFALSGISGGSVGLATYGAHLVEKAGNGPQASGPSEPWLERRLSVDGLSPTGLWWLFVELPRQFLQFQVERDRSQLLEESWEREWPGSELTTGMFELWREHQQVPLLLLNGTNVADGCRFNGSVLDANIEGRIRSTCRSLSPFDEGQVSAAEKLGSQAGVNAGSLLPATRDLADYVCGSRDVPLSSAAFLSARFPFVNPAGRVESACPEKTPGELAYVVDGGYLDTSGASPLIELSQSLVPMIEGWNRQQEGARCVVPFFVQIDNGFEDAGSDPAPRRPSELTLPLQTVFATRIARAAEARADSALIFNSPFLGARIEGRLLSDRYAHFVNQAHPGPRAPLGWTQSKASEKELRDQFRQRKNLAALREVRGWVDAAATGELACSE